jgi:hypothetical protein
VLLQQCAYRRRIVFVRYMAYKNRRKWAATEIQRHTRGILARRVAYSRVLAFVDNQFVHIGRERYVAPLGPSRAEQTACRPSSGSGTHPQEAETRTAVLMTERCWRRTNWSTVRP